MIPSKWAPAHDVVAILERPVATWRSADYSAVIRALERVQVRIEGLGGPCPERDELEAHRVRLRAGTRAYTRHHAARSPQARPGAAGIYGAPRGVPLDQFLAELGTHGLRPFRRW